MTSDREQLEFLLCETLDAGNGAAMPPVLRDWLGTEAGAAAINEYERLKGLLRGWRVLPANIDLKTHAAQISIAIGEDRESRSLTDLVPHWAGPVPDVDYSALKQRISAAVLRESVGLSHSEKKIAVKRRRVITWMGRIAAPLAVAAAIAIAIWWPRDISPISNGTSPIAQGRKDKRHPMVVVSLDTPKDTGKIKISFDEAAGKPHDTTTDEGPGMAVGTSQEDDQTSDDDAFLY
jgi:hypothetical protein